MKYLVFPFMEQIPNLLGIQSKSLGFQVSLSTDASGFTQANIHEGDKL